jgi:hypothetical protein
LSTLPSSAVRIARLTLAADRAVRLARERRDFRDQPRARLAHDRARRRQHLVVRGDRAAIGPFRTQQLIAALECADIRRERRRKRGIEVLEDAVDERAPQLGRAASELQIAGMKQHGLHGCQVRRARARPLAVELHLACSAARQPHAHDARHALAVHLGRELGVRRAALHHVRRGRTAEAAQAAEIVDRLEQVRLALPVVAEEHVEARPRRELERREVAKPLHPQLRDPQRLRHRCRRRAS